MADSEREEDELAEAVPDGTVEAGDPSTAAASNHAEIHGVEIFRTGRWNNVAYTRGDLDAMVNASKEMGYRPPVTLGHNAGDKDPAYGFVTNLRREGDILLADFTDVPDELVTQIRQRRYDNVSSEIFFNLKRNGRTFKRALRAVAVIGAHPPGVSDLRPLSELLSQFKATDRYETITEETSMAGDNDQAQAEIARLQEQLAVAVAEAESTKAEAERIKMAAPAADMQLTIQKLSEQVSVLRQQNADTVERERQGRITALVGSLDRPPYRSHIRALAELATKGDPGAPPAQVNFQAAGAEQAAPTSAFGVLEDLVRLINQDVSLLLTQQMRHGMIERNAMGLDDPAAEINSLVTSYMRANHGISVDEAQRLIVTDPKNADLVRRYNAAAGTVAN